MKRIIVVKGGKETGKTSVLNTVVRWMIETYQLENTVGFDVNDIRKDTFGVFTINAQKIGVDTSGEDESKIEELVSLGCDVILCACLTEGNRYQHLLSKYPYSKGFLVTPVEAVKVLPILISSTNLMKVKEVKDWVESMLD